MIKSFKENKDIMYNEEDLQSLYSTFFVTLFTTRLCNLNCEYCDVINRDKANSKLISKEEFNSLVKFLKNQENKRPNLNLHFFGGEPTLNPLLFEFIQTAQEDLEEYNLNIMITTNLSRSSAYYEKFEDVKIVASYHHDYVVNPTDWYCKAKELNRKGVFQHAVLMVTKDNMEDIFDLYLDWSKDFRCVMVPIDQIYNDEEYLKFKEDTIEMLDYNPFEHDDEYLNFYDNPNKKNLDMGLMCSSGILVKENGDVSYCFPRFDEKVFNVFENPEYQLSQFHFCNQMCNRCDLEILRSSIDFYNETLKFRSHSVNNKVLVQCNA